MDSERCSNFTINMRDCNCSYDPCPRKGICCECISYHKNMGQLPACYFPDSIEKTYNRSIRKFIEINS